jgi:hypothetical protein
MLRTILFLSVLSTGCSTFKGLTGSGGKPAGNGWSDTFTSAPKFDIPNVIEVKKPQCSTSGYTKLAIDEGKPFHIVAKASGSCASVSIINGSGQAANTAGNAIEVCAEKGPMTLASVGQPGGTYVATAEQYGCTGITLTLDTKPGVPEGAAPETTDPNMPPPLPTGPSEPPPL